MGRAVPVDDGTEDRVRLAVGRRDRGRMFPQQPVGPGDRVRFGPGRRHPRDRHPRDRHERATEQRGDADQRDTF